MTVKYVPAWFPGASFQRKARVWRAAITRMRLEPFAVTKSEFVRVPTLICIHHALLTKRC